MSALRDALPAMLFVDPEFDADHIARVGEVLRTLVAHRAVVAVGVGFARGDAYRDARFETPDLVSFQANVFAQETVAAAERLATAART